jgi:uncharacterized OsmC-like protein
MFHTASGDRRDDLLAADVDNALDGALELISGTEFHRSPPSLRLDRQVILLRFERNQNIVMNREQLQAVQEPLKERYRHDPDSALVTLRATGSLGEGITCSVATGRAIAEAGLHPATGGDGMTLCSGDMLLEALAACAGVTLRAVATSLGLDVAAGTVRVEGDLDFRGTLAVGKEAPVGFRSIRLSFELESDATDNELDTLLRLTERYCVVYQTIAVTPEMTATWARAPVDLDYLEEGS